MNRGFGFKQKIIRFMQGRYGVDQLSSFMIWCAVMLALIGMFVQSPIFTILCWVLIIFGYVRILSKNTTRRYTENQKFLDKTFGIRNAFAKVKYRVKYGKQTPEAYYIYKCKKCGQRIRIPKGKGKILITCPKCKYQFKKNSK
ncbi:MAG: hypothetical protein IJP29_02050 [Lachnospiraceae bacterium]|nr:hypothetical protein [Lachnospiraceae bacterium]